MGFIKFYAYSGLVSVCSGINGVLSTHYMISSLKTLGTKSTVNFVYKDIIGQTCGIGIAAFSSRHLHTNTFAIGLLGLILGQVGNYSEMCLRFSPKRYLLLTSTAGILRNVSWVTYGAANAKYITTLSKQCDTSVPEVYSLLAAVNTLGASLGMYIGTKLIYKNPYTLSGTLLAVQCFGLYNMDKIEYEQRTASK